MLFELIYEVRFLIIEVRLASISKSTKYPEYTPYRRRGSSPPSVGELDDRIHSARASRPPHHHHHHQTRCRRSVTEVKECTKNDDQRNTIKITKIRPVQPVKITAYFYRELLRTGPGPGRVELERQTHSYSWWWCSFLFKSWKQVLLFGYANDCADLVFIILLRNNLNFETIHLK